MIGTRPPRGAGRYPGRRVYVIALAPHMHLGTFHHAGERYLIGLQYAEPYAIKGWIAKRIPATRADPRNQRKGFPFVWSNAYHGWFR